MPGDQVSRLGATYTATALSASVWNVNSPPEWTPTYWSKTAACSTAAPAPAPATCSSSTWVQGQYYAAGSIVVYGGSTYVAKYANPGYNPTISTYYWAPKAC
jgi:hypothetical protein